MLRDYKWFRKLWGGGWWKPDGVNKWHRVYQRFWHPDYTVRVYTVMRKDSTFQMTGATLELLGQLELY